MGVGDIQALLAAPNAQCNCTGTTDGGASAKSYICGDFRLGPKKLPNRLPLLGLVSDYDRFGGLTPGEFVDNWTRNGSFVYPPQNGFQLDTAGNPIQANMALLPGTKVDRFGSEYGKHLRAYLRY